MLSNCHLAEAELKFREIKKGEQTKAGFFWICAECGKICMPNSEFSEIKIKKRRKTK